MRLFILASLLVLGCVTVPRPQTLAQRLNALVDDAEAQGALIGAYAVDVKTGEVIFAHRPHARSNPASTLKLATSAAALAALGPDFQFHTSIALQGQIADGVFEGDVVVTASGDPTLGSRHFFHTAGLPDRLAEAMKDRGIHQWRGGVRIIGDAAAPEDRLGPGWAWDDEAEDYDAPTGPFVFHDNVAHLIVRRSPSCSDVQMRIDPPLRGLTIDVSARAADQGDELACVPGIGGTALHCVWPFEPAGQCRRCDSTWVSIHDPKALFESSLTEALDRIGISHEEGATDADQAATQTLMDVASPPLSEIVYEMNKHSYNLCAERLAMAVARARTGTEGYAALHKALTEDQAARHIDPRDLYQVDGSGLSRYDLVTAYGLVQLVRSVLGTNYEQAFVASLPIAGVDGTLRSCKLKPHTCAWAKTGTLTGDRGFAGFIERTDDPAHPTVAFALLIGNSLETRATTTAFFDRFAEAMAWAPLTRACWW